MSLLINKKLEFLEHIQKKKYKMPNGNIYDVRQYENIKSCCCFDNKIIAFIMKE